MQSASKVVTKILIDYDQYLRLKKFEKEVESLNAKKTQDLRIVKEAEVESPQSNLIEKPTTQIGTGLAIPETLKEELISAVASQISQQFNLKALQHLLQASEVSQTGEGNSSSDLLPPIPTNTPLDVSQPPAYDYENVKCKQYDQFDVQKLLQSVPTRFKNKASTLLHNIQENPLEIDFDKKGQLYLDGKCLPNTNIFTIFPELYFRKLKKIIPGRNELASKIASKGWGHLILRGIVKGLKRPKTYNFHKDTHSSLKEFKNWWYMSM